MIKADVKGFEGVYDIECSGEANEICADIGLIIYEGYKKTNKTNTGGSSKSNSFNMFLMKVTAMAQQFDKIGGLLGMEDQKND